MNKMDKIDLIHSELNAEYNDSIMADYALLGTLKAIVTIEQLDKLIKMKGWNKWKVSNVYSVTTMAQQKI